MSRNQALAAAGAALLTVVAVVWWAGRGPSATEQRVTELIESSYDLAGFGDEPEPTLLNYGKDSFETGCENVDGDRFVGNRAAMRVDPDVDWPGGADRLADALESDGWTVARWWWLDADAARDERIVAASHDADVVVVALNASSIDISASSGPCIDAIEPFDPGGSFAQVDSFSG